MTCEGYKKTFHCCMVWFALPALYKDNAGFK